MGERVATITQIGLQAIVTRLQHRPSKGVETQGGVRWIPHTDQQLPSPRKSALAF